MQAIINELPVTRINGQSLIYTMIRDALSNVPFHQNTDAVTRYIARGFPLHLAVHEVSEVLVPPVAYTAPHVHDDYDEINIIISPQKLHYKILLDTDEYTMTNNSCIWIPRGMIHSANVVKGSGYFIAIRID